MVTSGENADENPAGARTGRRRACSGRLARGVARVIAPEGRFHGVTPGSGLRAVFRRVYLTTKLTSFPDT